jgi:hypothetical protein
MNDDGNLAYSSETSNEVRVFDSAHTTMQRTLTLSDDTTDNLIWCLVYCAQLDAYITAHKNGRVRVWRVDVAPTVRNKCDTLQNAKPN